MPGVVLDPPVLSTSPKCAMSPSMKRHGERDHLLVLEAGRIAYVSIPPHFSSTITEEGKLCFVDHRREAWESVSEMCCLQEAGHVHAHVHRGEITEDILLEQCLDEAGCALPMPWDLSTMLTPVSCHSDLEHQHTDSCGHNRIAHGDHYDWLIPLQDGSYMLSHAQATVDGGSQFIEHGRLVKVGESPGKLKRRPKQLVDLFGYVGPNKKGYDALPQAEELPMTKVEAPAQRTVDSGVQLASSPAVSIKEEMVKMTIPTSYKSHGMTKTTFDIMGLCCPAEVGLVRKLLEPLPGVDEVSVNAATKSATVLHDSVMIADVQIVKILNEARLDASIHQRGKLRMTHKWPSPWAISSGLLLLVSFIGYVWGPLKWVALASVAVALPPIIMRSFVALRRLVLDINFLMLIAIGGAIALGDYVEAGSIAFLFTIADWLESRSSDKARDAISTLADLAPQSAVLLDGQRVRVEDVSVGTLLAVKAGELIPIDGEVVSGKSSVDESTVTGESMPVEKETGQHIWAGTMNLSGYITIKTTTLVEDTAIARMIQLVEEAQNQQSVAEQLVEKFAKFYTPVVVASAVLIAIIPFVVHAHHSRHWLYLALVLLVVACPCALVISAPVTTTCGIAQAARAGLLVKGGSYLEALGKVKVVALDKTGTLTEGHFRVLDVYPVDGSTSLQQILFWISCIEKKSSHPLAPALVSYARLKGVEPSDDVLDFEILAGEGVTAVVAGQRIYIGNSRLAGRLGWLRASIVDERVEVWNRLGATVSWIGVNGKAVGVVGVADQLRPEAVEAVDKLKKLGVKIMMITGDSAGSASVVHSKIGDVVVHSELLPTDKVRLIREMKAIGITAMVGDGINDAPALAAADIGIAMGVAGSAVAMETADVALMTNDLRKIAAAIQLGQDCRMKIIQNVLLSFCTKVIIIVLAVCGYPSLWAAVLADVGTCLVVIFNSMRILNNKMGSSAIHVRRQPPCHTHGSSTSCCSRGPSESSCCMDNTIESKCCSDELVDSKTDSETDIQNKKSLLRHSHLHGHSHKQLKGGRGSDMILGNSPCSKTLVETKAGLDPIMQNKKGHKQWNLLRHCHGHSHRHNSRTCCSETSSNGGSCSELTTDRHCFSGGTVEAKTESDGIASQANGGQKRVVITCDCSNNTRDHTHQAVVPDDGRPPPVQCHSGQHHHDHARKQECVPVVSNLDVIRKGVGHTRHGNQDITIQQDETQLKVAIQQDETQLKVAGGSMNSSHRFCENTCGKYTIASGLSAEDPQMDIESVEHDQDNAPLIGGLCRRTGNKDCCSKECENGEGQELGCCSMGNLGTGCIPVDKVCEIESGIHTPRSHMVSNGKQATTDCCAKKKGMLAKGFDKVQK